MQVFLHRVADKYIERLNEPNKGYIVTALAGLEDEPPKGDIIPLAGQHRIFRLKIKKYRIIFQHRGDHILVTDIVPRGQAYKKNM